LLPLEDINYFTVTEAFQEALDQNTKELVLMTYKNEMDFQHWGWEEVDLYGTCRHHSRVMDRIAGILVACHQKAVFIIQFDPDSFAQWLYPTGFPNSQATRAKWTALKVVGGL